MPTEVKGGAIEALVGSTATRVQGGAIEALVGTTGTRVLGGMIEALVGPPLPVTSSGPFETRVQLQVDVAISTANTAPYSGSADHESSLTLLWSDGIATDQFNRGTTLTFTIAPLGTQVVDLETALMHNGFPLELTDLRLLYVATPTTNPAGPITLEPDATNGWTAYLQTGSVMDFPAGTQHQLIGPTSTPYVVSPTSKRILLTNTDAVDSAVVRLIIAGVSNTA